VAGLPPALEDLRIALLTDLHAGSDTPLGRVRRACRLAMRARPDLVALTGDLVSKGSGDALDPVVALLDEELAAPLGVYAVPGNHDHAAGIERWYRAVGRHLKIEALTNRAIVLDRGGATLRVAGVDSLREGDAEPAVALRAAPPADATVLLSHNPDLVEEACRALGPVDLVLSGHTHGGQVRLPFVGPVWNSSRHPNLFVSGLVRRPGGTVYVSRGVGTVHQPVRFLCRPEVPILELARA
jgi:predicted MPP superfamily phosphohydrolase